MGRLGVGTMAGSALGMGMDVSGAVRRSLHFGELAPPLPNKSLGTVASAPAAQLHGTSSSVMGVTGLNQGQVGRSHPVIGALPSVAPAASRSSSNKGLGFAAMSLGTRIGVGALSGGAMGGGTAGMSGGNIGQGMFAGAMIGGITGAAMGKRQMGMMSSMMRSRGISRPAAHTATRFGAMGGGMMAAGLGGVMFSGTRGQDKSRGFNSNKGSRVSSRGY